MMLQNLELKDPELILYCHQHCGDMGILSDETRVALGALNTAATDAIAADPHSSALILTDDIAPVRVLWRNLLIDSIHALKVRDAREKAAINQFDDSAPGNRSNARKKSAYGINELLQYFNAFDDFEGVLYGSDPLYRDHVVHVVRVWLIGARILLHEGIQELRVDNLTVAEPAGGGRVDGGQAGGGGLVICREELWAMWTIISLCHDLGYPLEKTYKINKTIDAMLRHFGQIVTSQYLYSFQGQHYALTEEMLKLVSSKLCPVPRNCKDRLDGATRYTTQVQEKYHTKFARSMASFSHGIVSCLVLLQSLVYFMETDYDVTGRGDLDAKDAHQFQIRREILRAIASHTCTEVYHLKLNTLSFLLILCDELQEWGRPTFGDMKLGQRAGDGDCKVTIRELNLSAGKVAISTSFPQGRDFKKRVKAKFREYHKLLRPAPKDEERTIDFDWEITIAGASYKMRFVPTAQPFHELSCTDGEESLDIYESES